MDIRELDLQRCDIGDAGFKGLEDFFSKAMATNIRFLGLERNNLTDKFAHFLHGNILCCGAQPRMLYLLETLYVSDNPITEDGMPSFAV